MKQPPARSVRDFVEHFSLLMANGVGLSENLQILAGQETDPRMRAVIEDLGRRVILHGQSLSSAMRVHANVFPGSVRTLVQVGETGGALVESLRRAVELLDRRAALEMQVRKALTGPTFTLLFGGVVVLGVVRGVMPRFVELYDRMDVPLPMISRLVLGSVAVLNHPLTLALGLGLGILIVARRSKIENWLFDRALRTPILGSWLGTLLCSEFCQLTACLEAQGVPLQRSLQCLVESARSPLHRETLERMEQRFLVEGSLAAALEEVPYFPTIARVMCAVGEESGSLQTMLDSVGRILSVKVDLVTDQVMALLEPAVLIVLGVSMGVTFVGLFLPIYGTLSRLGS